MIIIISLTWTKLTGEAFLAGVALLDDSLDADEALEDEADDDVEPENKNFLSLQHFLKSCTSGRVQSIAI